MNRIQSMVWVISFACLLNNGALAKEPTDSSGYVMVRMPKLQITVTWLKEYPHTGIPENLYGQTVSIIHLSADKTFLLTDEGDIVQLNGTIEGNYCEYEWEYDQQGNAYLKNEFQAKTTTIIPFDSLGLPPFRSFKGTYSDIQERAQGFPFMGIGSAIEIAVRSNWTKELHPLSSYGIELAYYTIPFSFHSHTQKSIINFKPFIYLEDRNGLKYYPLSNKQEQYVDIPEFGSWPPIQMQIRFEATADDFFLRPAVETDEGKILFSSPFGDYDWESKAFEKNVFYTTAEEVLAKLTNLLRYASTQSGYDRLLSKISFLWLKAGRYEDVLSVANKVLSRDTSNTSKSNTEEKVFLKRQQIVALMRTHKFARALFELSTIEKIIPKNYSDFLIRNCLRQIEIEHDIECAERKATEMGIATDRAQSYSRTQFDALVITTPLVDEVNVNEKLVAMKSIQGQYEEAVYQYHERWDADAKTILIKLIEAPSDQTVSYLDHTYKVVPAALDLLGRTCWHNGDISGAMMYFKKMEELPNDIFYGPVYGEGAYGGPAGAEGMGQQIELLDDPNSWSSTKNFKPDYEAAIQLAHSLINKYRGIESICWEGCSTYDVIGAYYITECLKKMKAPLARQEEEIRWIVKVSKNNYLSAEKLLDLAKKKMKSGDDAGADKIYSEIIEKYSSLMPLDDPYEEDCRVYALDAYLGLLENAKVQKNDERYNSLRHEAIKTYDQIRKKYVTEKDEDHRRGLEKRYGRIGKN